MTRLIVAACTAAVAASAVTGLVATTGNAIGHGRHTRPHPHTAIPAHSGPATGRRHHWHHGVASWFTGAYGACGRPLRRMYAANRTMRCGTRLRVCRRHRCVTVRVLDRGPYIAGRDLDVSRAAADALHMTSIGVGRIRYRVVSR